MTTEPASPEPDQAVEPPRRRWQDSAAIIALLLVVASAFMPWLQFRPRTIDAFSLSWSGFGNYSRFYLDTLDHAWASVGVVIVATPVVIAVLSLRGGFVWLRRALAVAVVAIGVAFVIQVAQSLDGDQALMVTGLGPQVAIIAGLLLVYTPTE